MMTNRGNDMLAQAMREVLTATPVELVPLVAPHAVIEGQTGQLVRLPLADPPLAYAEITRPGSGLLRQPVQWADLNDGAGGRAFGGTWQVDDVGELPVHVHAIGVVAVTPGGPVTYVIGVDDAVLSAAGDVLQFAQPWPIVDEHGDHAADVTVTAAASEQ